MNWELAFFVALVGSCLVGILWAWQQQQDIEGYLVAHRGINLVTGGLSTGAGWIHAPAVLVSGLFAYWGPWHFIAFFVPNVCALLLQAWIAPRLRTKMRASGQKWYTMAQAIGAIYGSPAVRTMMFVASFCALSLAVGYTFAGIRQWVEQLWGFAAHEISIAIGAASLFFVIFSGLPAAIKSDKVKMAIIGVGIVATLTLAITVALGGVAAFGPPLQALERGLSPGQVLWFIGVPFAASLLGGPMCNPDLPERLLAIEEKSVRLAYVQGAMYFALATLTFGLFGYVARLLGIAAGPGQLPIVAVTQYLLPGWGLYVVTVGIIAILTMALASLLASAGDVVSIELIQRFFRPHASDRETIAWSRASMLTVILVGSYLTSFKQINVAFLLESMAVVRGEAIFPVIFAAACAIGRVDPRYVFGGIIAGFTGGLIIFLGWFAMDPNLSKAFPLIASLGKPIGELPLVAVHGKAMASLWAVFVPCIGCVLGLKPNIQVAPATNGT